MNETFNFSRFWTYFKYDLKQMWRNHSKAAILIGGASAIFYVIWLLCSLVFAQHWTTPPSRRASSSLSSLSPSWSSTRSEPMAI
jgi:hypothetical protein